MTTRRGFLGSILAACAAPAIVRAESLMILPSRKLLLPATTLVLADPPTWTAADGLGAFRYVVLYNDSAAGPSDLLGWWDYGSSVELANGETFTADSPGLVAADKSRMRLTSVRPEAGTHWLTDYQKKIVGGIFGK
jgi:hypothetical protein